MTRHWQHHRRGHHGPPPFVRRFGCFFAALLLFTVIGVGTLVSSFFRGPERLGPIVAVGTVVAIVLIVGFTSAFRRVARTFRAQDALRRQLMADVAHELRTPLSILQGRVEGMLDGVYPRDDARLNELLTETRHLARLVEDVRTLANAEAGALELRKERVELAELIREAASAFPAVTIDVEDAPELDVDPVRIREVLLNLLTNAVRAGGAVRIDARATDGRVVIRVSDTGSGIPPEELPRIFDRFTKSRDSGGSGLGLAIAKKLVEAHDGTIRAESRVGEGTTIIVTLPR